MPNTEVIPNFIACVYLGDEGQLKFGEVADPVITKVLEPVEGPTPTVKDSTIKDTTTINKQTNNKKATDPSKSTGKKYTVKKGDNLTRIAAKHHVTISDLMTWNSLKNDKIFEGQTLIIKK